MGSPIFKAVSDARQTVAKELDNANSYLTKAIDEKRSTQAKVAALQNTLALFDAWILANPDV